MLISGEEIFRQKEDKPSVYVCMCVRVFIYMTDDVVPFALHTLMPGHTRSASPDVHFGLHTLMPVQALMSL